MKCATCQQDLGDEGTRAAYISVETAEGEYIYSYWRCGACGTYMLEAYRDRPTGSPEVNIEGPIDAKEGDAMVAFLSQCPDPGDPQCGCAVHRQLTAQSTDAPTSVQGDSGNGTNHQPESDGQNAGAPGQRTILVKCPMCAKPTDSLKRYGVMCEVVFLGIYARSRRCAYTACPKCMRRTVLKDTFSPLNILLANLMWILAIFPYCIGVMIATAIPGHSRSIERLIHENK